MKSASLSLRDVTFRAWRWSKPFIRRLFSGLMQAPLPLLPGLELCFENPTLLNGTALTTTRRNERFFRINIGDWRIYRRLSHGVLRLEQWLLAAHNGSGCVLPGLPAATALFVRLSQSNSQGVVFVDKAW
jgi:hypothetical protein